MTVGGMMAVAGWAAPPATAEELDRLAAEAMRACHAMAVEHRKKHPPAVRPVQLRLGE